MAIIHGASWCGEKLSGGCILLSSDPSPPLVEDFKPSLFAVLDGDDLFFPRNFRSEERAFQFLWRMADAMEPGCAFLIQTTNVGCSPLRHFVDGDRKSFCEKEVVSRAPLAYPPHRHLIVQKFLAVGDEFFADFTDRWGALLTSICSSVANSEWKGPIFRKGGGRPAKRSATFWIFTADPEKFFVSLEKGRASNFAPGNGIEERISVDPF
jgi:hypothetical protein